MRLNFTITISAMTNIYTLKGTDTKLVVKKGRIENETSDVIVNWVSLDLKRGPESFYRIHQKAGRQLKDFCLTFEVMLEDIKFCDAFSTMPAQLDCKLVVHSIIPEFKITYHTSWYNISEVIKTYKSDNKCDSVSLYLFEESEINLKAINELMFDLGLREMIIVCETDAETKMVTNFFKPRFYRKSFNDIFDACMVYIGSIKKLDELTKKYYGWKSRKRTGGDN